ncbi:hypothetical protein ONZ45_g18241 [Pleurotus djamor]|nr:hypothetical protein ONZ45_g18241 [Pleurotus djamor]
MKKHMSSNVDAAPKAFEQDDEEMSGPITEPPAEPVAPVVDDTSQTILQTSRLFLRNLTFSCTEGEIEELFRPYGDIAQIHIPLDPLSKQAKGLAYITFRQGSSALAAYNALDKKSFQGRLLHILPAVDRKGKSEVVEGTGRKSVKEDRAEKRKSTAGTGFNWSMLYMNSDAVVSSVASRMNIPKSEILNSESDNAAVKLALAETHIINETKTYLESQGVVLSSFGNKGRSDTTILVKNIPFGTTLEQITEMFQQYGTLSRVLVPPAGTMAVVEFEHADEAQKAFKGIAYRRLGNSIIYLEKGPQGVFLPVDGDKPSDGPSTSTAVKPIRITEQEQVASEGDLPSLAAGTTLFVKNLAFSTTTERLTQVFSHLPSFSFARVQTKPDPKKPGKDAPRLSMGYGFVGFKDVEGAKKGLKSMQDFVLDGHALHVKFAGRGQEESEDTSKGSAGSKNKTTTKMIVKNLPFEASKKDVRALFSAHGQLKSVRVPKRFDARSRGFAFLEFVSRLEAENAYNALKHTHLLGRHLVLQWAEEAEDIESLRLKASVGFGGGKEMPGRKRKIDLGGDNDGDVEGLEE